MKFKTMKLLWRFAFSQMRSWAGLRKAGFHLPTSLKEQSTRTEHYMDRLKKISRHVHVKAGTLPTAFSATNKTNKSAAIKLQVRLSMTLNFVIVPAPFPSLIRHIRHKANQIKELVKFLEV